MKMPKPPKPKRKRQPPPAQLHQQRQPSPQPNNRRTIADRIQNHPIVAVLSLVAVLLAVGDPIYEALKMPVVSSPSYSTADPFLLHFQIRNPSWLFQMNDASIRCIVETAKFEGGSKATNDVFAFSMHLEIPPKQSLAYRCPLRFALGGLGPATNVTLVIAGTYFAPWGKRSFTSEQFNWDSVTREWSEGPLID